MLDLVETTHCVERTPSSLSRGLPIASGLQTGEQPWLTMPPSNESSNAPVDTRRPSMHYLDWTSREPAAQSYQTTLVNTGWTARESLITRRSQVQILPPPLRKPRSDAMSDLGFVVLRLPDRVEQVLRDVDAMIAGFAGALDRDRLLTSGTG